MLTKKTMMICSLVTITVLQYAANELINDNNIWYAAQFIALLENTILLIFLTMFIPYRQLFLKTIAAFWCAASLTDTLIYPLWFLHYDTANIAYGSQLVLSVVAFFYICIKSYSKVPSDTVRNGYVYQVRAVPRRPQDMILSVLYLRPFGGTGVIIDGQWYHYRKGRLQRDEYSRIPLDKCVILETRKVKPGDRESLDSRLGEKWTWTRNCATTLHPLTVWHRFR